MAPNRPLIALISCLGLGLALAGTKEFEIEALVYTDPCSDSSSLATMLRELRAAFSQVKTFFVSILPSLLPRSPRRHEYRV